MEKVGFGVASCLLLYGLRRRVHSGHKGFIRDASDDKFRVGEVRKGKDFEEKLQRILRDGPDKLRVVIDFDYTMTTFWLRGERGFSCHRIIEECGLLPQSYHTKAKALQQKYFPLEISTEITFEEKHKYMVEWVEKAHEALIESGLRKEHLPIAVAKANVALREGVEEFLDEMEALNIPVLIFSAGIADVLEEVLKQKEHHRHKNVSIVSNRMCFDEKSGKLIGFEAELDGREPFHVFNKNYGAISQQEKDKHNASWGDERTRPNVLLLGDSIGDSHMADGMFDHIDAKEAEKRFLRIGFLNHHISERLDEYLGKYDALVLNDGDFNFVRESIKYKS